MLASSAFKTSILSPLPVSLFFSFQQLWATLWLAWYILYILYILQTTRCTRYSCLAALPFSASQSVQMWSSVAKVVSASLVKQKDKYHGSLSSLSGKLFLFLSSIFTFHISHFTIYIFMLLFTQFREQFAVWMPVNSSKFRWVALTEISKKSHFHSIDCHPAAVYISHIASRISSICYTLFTSFSWCTTFERRKKISTRLH